MSKNNRQRRQAKQHRAQARGRAARAQADKERRQRPAPTVVYRSIGNPFQGLTSGELVTERTRVAQSARSAYAAGLAELEGSLLRHDGFHAVSMLARHGLMTGVGKNGVDKTSVVGQSITQAHVEFYQALFIHTSPSLTGERPVIPAEFEPLYRALGSTLQAVALRDLDTLDTADRDPAVSTAQAYVRTRTRMVRNWGYFEQVKRITRELYGVFERQGSGDEAFSPLDVVDVFEHLLVGIETTSLSFLQALAPVFDTRDGDELIERYMAMLDLPDDETLAMLALARERNLSLDERRSMLLGHHDLLNRALFTIDSNAVAKALAFPEARVMAILDAYALAPGQLDSHDIEHFHLDNPVWLRPVIRSPDDPYFCALPQTFFSHIFPALDRHFKPALGAALAERRATYLEERVADVMRSAFPDAQLCPGLTWSDDGERFETDLLVLVDSFALIVEAKSARVTDSALRGADARMRRHFQELLIAPNDQSKRLMAKLLRMRDGKEVDDDLMAKLPVELSSIRQVLRLSVTLDDFATMQANVSRWKDTGWVPADYVPCPTLCLSDLETLVDLLEDPCLVMHYLQTRQEIEHQLDYIGDELDLMGLYLHNLFDIFADEGAPTLTISGMSSPLDQYYASKDAGVTLPKPRPPIRPFFRRLLEQLRDSRPGWMAIGVIVCRFARDEQRQVERWVRQCARNVRRRPFDPEVNNTIVLTGPGYAPHAMTISVYDERSRNRRREFQQNACRLGLEKDHVQLTATFLINANDRDRAYDHVTLAWPDHASR